MNTFCSNAIISEDYVDFIADYELAPDERFSGYEICYTKINTTYTAVYIPKELAPERSLDEYGYKVFVRLFGLMDEQSIEASGVKTLRSVPGLNLRGQGVLIGIVDTGIDYTHKAFVKADGTTKIVSIWDQSIPTGSPPDGFNYGTEYLSDQINTALINQDPKSIVPSTDDIGHGTFWQG